MCIVCADSQYYTMYLRVLIIQFEVSTIVDKRVVSILLTHLLTYMLIKPLILDCRLGDMLIELFWCGAFS